METTREFSSDKIRQFFLLSIKLKNHDEFKNFKENHRDFIAEHSNGKSFDEISVS